MPRTIDSIVENHRRARELTAAGRPVWGRTINIKAILLRDPDTTSDEHAASVANEIAALLKRELPADYFDVTAPRYNSVLEEAVEELASLTSDSFGGDDSYTVADCLNGRLDEIYDFADRERIWLGP